MRHPEVEIKPTVCPHDCPDVCGMLAHVDSTTGRLLKLRGDPEHPITRGTLCAKMSHYADRVYGADRILYPMRRVGPKGKGMFERISWDEALQAITARFGQIAERFGAEALLPYSFAGTMGVVNNATMDRRFFYRLGASRLVRSIRSSAGNVGHTYTVGASLGTDPESVPSARLIISWGCNIVTTNLHQMPFIQEARRQGATFIVIDVHRNKTAQLADHFIHLYPGTDGALASAMMNVIIEEQLYDAEYVTRHTLGFKELRQRVKDYPPEKVAELTGVEADRIRWLARLYATIRPSFIRLGNGLQHHSNGGMIIRTISCLPALVGAWGEPGGGMLKANASVFGLNTQALERPDLLGSRKPRFINMNQLGEALLSANPPVRALYVYNSNPAAVAPAQAKVMAGLRREDLFTVVHEQLMTDTAAHADIVLPATSSLEHLDLYKTYWHLYLQLAEPVIEPVGESKPNVEVFRLLAERMGFDDPCFKDTPEDIIRQALDTDCEYLKGITLERLKKEKRIRVNLDGYPHVAFADGRFPTPSGKVEFYSEKMLADGHDPLPKHEPTAEGRDNPAAAIQYARYPLMLVTAPAHNFLNSTFANLSKTLEAEQRPTLDINPVDASARGIATGDVVRVWNDRGSCRVYARVTDAVLPEVVVGPGVWWPKHSLDGGNLNQTTPDVLADMGGGATFFSNLVQVDKNS